LAVEAMSVHVKWSGDDCHFTMLPVCPLKLTVAVLPVHISELLALPPTDAGPTVTVTGSLLGVAQGLPLVLHMSVLAPDQDGVPEAVAVALICTLNVPP
jgi:hypothetical protein